MTAEDVPALSAEKMRELLSELATLSKLQTDALEDLAYLGMSSHLVDWRYQEGSPDVCFALSP